MDVKCQQTRNILKTSCCKILRSCSGNTNQKTEENERSAEKWRSYISSISFIFAHILSSAGQSDELTVPVLVGEEFKEAPELLGHAGVALHERERR